LDAEAFPAVDLARRVGAAAGTFPAVFNAANEECVAAFLSRRVGFPAIVDTVRGVVDDWAEHPDSSQPLSLEGVLEAERWARRRAATVLGELP
jgi:1-deoxy-D-xylulose-5-phosphate reductoisomerase